MDRDQKENKTINSIIAALVGGAAAVATVALVDKNNRRKLLKLIEDIKNKGKDIKDKTSKITKNAEKGIHR